MFELLITIAIVFAFLYLKNKIDQLRNQVNDLRIKAGIESPKKSDGFSLGEGVVLSDEEKVMAAPVAEMPVVAITEKEPEMLLPSPQPVAELKEKLAEDLEFKFGSKIFTGVGVIAVICAVGFFLRYAFENNLINEFGRVAMGVAAGIILLAVGELTRKRFPNYGQSLTGGGLGTLYLSFYAAFSFYKLMAQPAAFFAMILVTAAGILLSLRQNSMGLAVFAQVGGFLTPLLINSGSGSPHILFLYIALLDLAVFLIAFYKLWQPLSAASLLGTVLVYLYWYSNFYDSIQFAPAFGYLTLFFAIFLYIPFIQYFVKKSPENSWDLSLVSFNPLFYFAMSYALIDPLYHNVVGIFTFILGTLYCVLAAVVGGKDDRASLFRHFLLTAGFILLAVAVPIQFDGKWVIAAWAAESLAFIATGFKMKSGIYRFLGNVLFVITLFKLLFLEGKLPIGATPVFNGRFLSYAIFMMVAAGATYLYRHYQNRIRDDEKLMISILALEAALAAVVGSSIEIYDFAENYGKWTVIVWAAEALALIVIGFRAKLLSYRIFGQLIFFVALARLLLNEGDLPVGSMPLFNMRLLSYLVIFAVAVVAAWAYRRSKNELGGNEKQFFSFLALEGAFAGLAGFSFEIRDFYGSYWYPILWTGGGLAAGVLSFRLNNLTLRCVTYATFSVAFIRLLAFENHINLPDYTFLLNTRVAAFLASAAIIRIFLSLFRYHKNKLNADEYAFFQPALFMAFHFLVLWIISAEIIDYCDQQALYSAKSTAIYDFGNIKNVLLSGAWTVYGVILLITGIIKKAVYERFLAIALFAIVVFKVFFVDTANLGNLYRFFSFITLGCLLLLSGYLYYRYQDRIRNFVKGN